MRKQPRKNDLEMGVLRSWDKCVVAFGSRQVNVDRYMDHSYIYIWVFDIQAYRCAIIKLQFVEYEKKNRVTLVSIVDLETPIRGCSNLQRLVTLINDINQLLHQLLNIRSRIYIFSGYTIYVLFFFFFVLQIWTNLAAAPATEAARQEGTSDVTAKRGVFWATGAHRHS